MNSSSLIEGIKRKDQQAFETLYHETKHAVYAMVLPIVKDRSLAEDVMQDTYIKMVQRIHQYNENYLFINWLLTIAKNTALDTLKARKDLLVDSTDISDMFIEQRSGIEKHLEVEHYLKVLTDTEREIVLLKVVGELTHKTIAKQLSLPQGTVRYHYKTALAKMKQLGKGGMR